MISVEEPLPRHAETIDEVREEKEVEDTYFGRLAAQSKQRAALRGVNLECTIKPGNEVETIVSFAREGQFDLLVVGFMGHSRIFGRIWGGTSQKLDEDSPLFSFGREIIVSLSETGMSQRRRARILEILCDLARPAELGRLDDLLDGPVEAVRWKSC